MQNIRREVHCEGRIVPSFAERPADLDSMFRAAVKRAPSSIAVVEGDRRVTYAELSATVDRIAGNLSRLGIARGDRVAILLGNRVAFVEISLSCTRVGAIQVPINIRQRKPENQYVLAHSGAVALVHEADLLDQIPDTRSIPELRHRFAVGGEAAGSDPYESLLTPSQPPVPAAAAEDDSYILPGRRAGRRGRSSRISAPFILVCTTLGPLAFARASAQSWRYQPRMSPASLP